MFETQYTESKKKSEQDLSFDAFTKPNFIDLNTQPLLRYYDNGVPLEKINADSYADDYAGYWAMHARKLWIITAFCALYLSLKLFGAW